MDDQELVDALPGLLGYARALSRDEDAAEDLLSETVARALERRDQFRGDAALATWLHRMMHNLAVDRARRTREFPAGDELIAQRVEKRWRDDRYTVDAAVVADRAMDAEKVRVALVHVPVGYRSALVLHDMFGLSGAEVAERLTIGLPAAKQRIRRGRMMLVSKLAEGHEQLNAELKVPMACWDARRVVEDYLDGELPLGERAAVEAHLARCPTCPPLLAALVPTRDTIAGLQDADTVLPEALLRRLSR